MSNVTVLDSAGATKTVKTTTSGGIETPHQNVDAVTLNGGANDLGKTRDVAAGPADRGVLAMAVRSDTAVSLVGANGDNTPLAVDASGQMRIAAAPANAGVNIGNVSPVPRSSGGCSSHSRLSTGASGDATNVKNSAGQLYGLRVSNINASPRYLKLYDSASAPTAGSGTPVRRVMVPAGGRVDMVFPVGLAFASGIGYTLVTGAADANSTAVASAELIVELEYA